jgi:hypothetical protein
MAAWPAWAHGGGAASAYRITVRKHCTWSVQFMLPVDEHMRLDLEAHVEHMDAAFSAEVAASCRKTASIADDDAS